MLEKIRSLWPSFAQVTTTHVQDGTVKVLQSDSGIDALATQSDWSNLLQYAASLAEKPEEQCQVLELQIVGALQAGHFENALVAMFKIASLDAQQMQSSIDTAKQDKRLCSLLLYGAGQCAKNPDLLERTIDLLTNKCLLRAGECAWQCFFDALDGNDTQCTILQRLLRRLQFGSGGGLVRSEILRGVVRLFTC